MKLSPDDVKLYYGMFFPLLDYVNQKRNIAPDLPPMPPGGYPEGAVHPEAAVKVARNIWAEPSAIDDFLADHPEITGERREILASWKRVVSGQFLLERILKKGAVFIDMKTEEVYLVQGLVSDWEEMTFGWPRPLMLRTSLLPFRDVIIYDSLAEFMPITFGGGFKAEYREIYSNARNAKRIHTSL